MALFNLSKYATAYIKDGEVYGVTVSGYRETEDGEKKFANIWIPTADSNAKITKRPDGSYILSVKLLDVKKKVKGGVEGRGAVKKQTKKTTAPRAEEDDGEDPF